MANSASEWSNNGIPSDDINCLISLSVIGKSICQLEGLDVWLAIDLLVHSLGISHSKSFYEINTKGEASGLIG